MGALIGTAVTKTTSTFWNLAMDMLHIFGPDANNVPASMLEQAIEAAADNVQLLYRNGLITNTERLNAQQSLLAQGQQAFQQIIARGGDVRPFQKGLQNMTATVAAEMQANPPVVPNGQSLSLATARMLYISSGNWYPGSLQKAAQLTDAIVTDLTSNPIAQIGSITGGIGSAIMSIFGGTAVNPGGTAQAGVASGGGSGTLWLFAGIALLWKFGKKIF